MEDICKDEQGRSSDLSIEDRVIKDADVNVDKTNEAEGFPMDETVIEGRREEDDHIIDSIIPKVDEELKPLKGKMFDSLEDGEMFFRNYAKHAGFSVRMGSTLWTKEKEGEPRHIYSKCFLCSREGHRRPRKNGDEQSVKRKRKITRMGCKAGIRIQENHKRHWIVVKFEEFHTHKLASPPKIQLLKSHPKATKPKKALSDSCDGANIGTSHIKTEMEIQMAEVYTQVNFDRFQKELKENLQYGAFLTKNNGSVQLYEVQKPSDIGTRQRVTYKVFEKLASCSCMMFEIEGIPCRHILCVLRNNLISKLPDHYILKRLTESMSQQVECDYDRFVSQGDCDTIIASRRSILSVKFSKILDMACSSDEAFSLAYQALDRLQKDLGNMGIRYSEVRQINQTLVPSRVEIHSPYSAKMKESRRQTKGQKEKAIEHVIKGRLCHGCQKRGVKHDKHNCAILREKHPSVTVDGSVCNDSQASVASVSNKELVKPF